MSETLVIRLRALEEAPASWLVVDANGARSGQLQTGPLADALGAAQGRRVLLLLPGGEISLTEPELPVRGGARVFQAVPFALEEQLASELEGLHFAVGSRGPGAAGTPVAVVARSLLERWLGLCETAGIHPDAAQADTGAVPLSPNGCTLFLDDATLFVRRANAVPYALDADPLGTALDLALGQPSEGGEHVTFYASPADYERHRDAIEGLRTRTATLQVKLMPDGPLPLLAAQAVAAPGVNLLQGAFAPAATIGNRLREWRVPAALAAAVVLAFLVGQGLSLYQLSRAEKQVDAQIAELFAQVLPGQPVVDPKAQIQGVIGGGGAQHGTLLPAISVLAEAMARAPAARIEAISYRGNALDLRLVAPSVEALDAIKQGMTRDGLAAELQSATPRGDVHEGRLQVRFGKS
jgi:general secretion pathway protein L